MKSSVPVGVTADWVYGDCRHLPIRESAVCISYQFTTDRIVQFAAGHAAGRSGCFTGSPGVSHGLP